MIVTGIDPGKQGGIAFMDEGKNCLAYPLPQVNGKVDVGKLQELILEYYHSWLSKHHSWLSKHFTFEYKAFIEIQQVRGGQKGQFGIAENYGRITAILDLLSIQIEEVRPVEWKGMLPPREEGETDKDVSIQYCLDLEYKLPTLKPKGKKLHDGIADAICIALYGWEQIEFPE